MSGHDIVVDAGDIKLSGLLAEPAGTSPIAVVVAIPGSGMLGRYFDGPVDGAASLLALGAAQGFTVWAIDRPGYGASAGVPDERIDIVGQAGNRAPERSTLSRASTTSAPASSWSATRTGSSSRW